MWRYGVALADDGWYAAAVDLRGHGTAPRALDYTIAAYAADLAATAPADGEPWDLVIGHSLGGAASTVAAAAHPAWTRRLILIDPGDPPERPRPAGRAREPGGVLRRSVAGGRAPRPSARGTSTTSS